ncbi:MAG: Wzz/FepE/Etk N-terminal domain-containing protein [Bacilli bacterium]
MNTKNKKDNLNEVNKPVSSDTDILTTHNNSDDDNEKEGLSFKDILFILRKHLLAILLFIIVGGVGGEIYNLVEPNTYSSDATLIVSPESSTSTGDSSTVSDYQYSSYISKTYVAFIKQDVVLDEVLSLIDKDSNYEIDEKELSKNLGVSLVDATLVVSVSYTSTDKNETKFVANLVAKKAVEIANRKNEDDSPKYKLLYDNIAILSDAKVGVEVSHTLRNIGIGLAIGVVLAIIYTCIREATNTKFKSSDEVEKALGISVLGVIPFYDIDTKNKKENK